jgi:PAS domain S-box-containing protein
LCDRELAAHLAGPVTPDLAIGRAVLAILAIPSSSSVKNVSTTTLESTPGVHVTYDDILEQDQHAFIEVDEDGFIVRINKHFTALLGWDDTIIGKPLATIVPDHMHDAHHLGFSRFVMTGEPHLLESDVTLPTMHASGENMPMVHHIAASSHNGVWRIVSMVRST